MKFLVSTLVCLLASVNASAMSIDWTGVYRVEFTQLTKPTLSNPDGTKYYGLNYLSLSPKIIAADGVNIISKFDVLAPDSGAYTNSQVGQIWGSNSSVGTLSVPNTGSDSVTSSRNQGASNLKVSQLYLNVNQEYGALIVGRAPFHFGLGMTYNSGAGLFDHWYQTRDMVAYKFIIGDWSFMPMTSRIYSSSTALGNSANELAFQLTYENKDSRSMLGIIQNTRKASSPINDLPVAAYQGDSTKAISEYSIQKTNFVFGRDWDTFGFKFEAAFESGDTGLQNSLSQPISMNSYGIATELNFAQPESKWNYKVRFGMASGDNPDTATYEGFNFDPNYNVAQLMFNHRLGSKDFFNSNRSKNSTLTVSNSVDDETVGNTFYLAPTFSYAWNDRLDLNNTLVYAQLLNTMKNSVDAKKDLGLEWDVELVYKPVERVQWVNQLGLLFPGSAWKNGTSNLDNGFAYGFTTKAAISF